MNDEVKHDIEYYKQAYEELKLIMDLSFDQITIAGGNGIFTKVSKSCENSFGIKEKDLIGESAFKLEKEGIFDTSVTAEVLRKGKKMTIIQKTAADKKLMVTGIPIFDDEKNIIKIINISKDVTQNEKLNEELEEVRNELQWFHKELNKRQGIYQEDIIYKSKEMNKVIEMINQISDLEATILLLGETGVGKGFVAKRIHENSIRKNQPFVKINCGAIPENLLESELFGYEKGAFTGAGKFGKKGLFEIAREGTIFLDEIGDMPLNLQVKILHVLDTTQIFRVGGEKPIEVGGRIIAATNKNLEKLVKEGKFREDLFYRLNVVPIKIPSLRERKDDIAFIAKNFLDKFNKKYGTTKKLDQSSYRVLSQYNYPGNIRELQNIVERLVISLHKEIISDEDILDLVNISSTLNITSDEIIPIKEAVEKLEKDLLTKAFKKYKTTRKVGEALQIDQSTVVKKSKKLKIKY